MARFRHYTTALFGAGLAVTAACAAAAPTEFSFRLEQRQGDRVKADFRRLDRPNSQWNSTYAASDLPGLDRLRLAAPGNGPLRFAVVRDAGRLDCAGTGGRGAASGRCRYTADKGFADFLRRSGIPALSGEDAYVMTAVGVRRDLVTAIRQAKYPAPDVQELISLAALGVERGYVDRLSAAGYRPASISTLIEFKALGITPDYIGDLNRLGFGRMPASQIVQFKVLGIDRAYIEGLMRAGYGGLAPGTLVEFKALGVTPGFIEQLRARGFGDLTPGKIVQMKALGIKSGDVAPRRGANRR